MKYSNPCGGGGGVMASMSSVGGCNGRSFGDPKNFVQHKYDPLLPAPLPSSSSHANPYRGAINCTKNEPNSWMAVDLGATRLFEPTFYALRADDSDDDACKLCNWVLEGSKDGVVWNVLRQHVDDSSCHEPMLIKQWELDDKVVAGNTVFFEKSPFHYGLCCNTSMISSGHPKCHISLHSLGADKNVLKGVIECMSEMERTGYVRWRNND